LILGFVDVSAHTSCIVVIPQQDQFERARVAVAVHVAGSGGVAEHGGVSAETAMTLGEPFWKGYTALPIGEGIPNDDVVPWHADEETEAMTAPVEAPVVVPWLWHGDATGGNRVRRL
jgi:hypothetical protein